MDKRIATLIIKHTLQVITPSEQQELDDWREADERHEKAFLWLSNRDNFEKDYRFRQSIDVDYSLQEFKERLESEQTTKVVPLRSRLFNTKLHRVAAVIILLIMGGAFWYHREYTRVTPPEISQEVEYAMQESQSKGWQGAEIITSATPQKQVITEEESARYHVDEDFAEQLAEAKRNNSALQRALDKSLTNTSQNNVSIEKLVDQINESNQYIRHLVEVKSKSDSLNMVLTNNLTRSLSKEELSEVDVQVLKGVVYISLADNMLYKSGSYEINSRASQTLSKIAKIIKDYKDYDVLIEGNTDDVPISRENIRNNWDLSCLRASSVVQALQNEYGVDPKRLTAGGRGEYNPLQPNTTELGKQRNRRTQIIITPKLDQFMDLIDKAPEK